MSRAVREYLGHSVLAGIGFAAAVILLLAALFAPWITPADPRHRTCRRGSLLHPARTGWGRTNSAGHSVAHLIWSANLAARFRLSWFAVVDLSD